MLTLSLRASDALDRSTGKVLRSAQEPVSRSPSERDTARASLLGFDRAFLASHLGATLGAAGFDTMELFDYAPSEGSLALRGSIAASCGVAARHVQVTGGASEGLALLLAATLDSGDRVLVPSPGLPAYPRMASWFGAVPLEYPVCEDARETVERVLDATRLTGAKVVLLNPVHNPTGRCLAGSHLASLVQRCTDLGAMVLLDDAYSWMAGPSDRLSSQLPALFQVSERIAVVCSIGKHLCLPGLRLGAVITPHHALHSAVGELRRHLTHSSSPPMETLATRLMNAPEHHAAKLRLHQALVQRRLVLEAWLTTNDAQPCLGGQGFYVYAECAAGLDSIGVLGLPGIAFGGTESARRYCLASDSGAWARIQPQGT